MYRQVVLAQVRQRAPFAAGWAHPANPAAVTDEVNMEAVIDAGRDERTKQLVRFFIRGGLRNPTEPPGHAKNVRVHGEPVCTPSTKIVSCPILGCAAFDLDWFFQKRRKPSPCQRRRVSGWMGTRACSQ